MTHDPVQLEIFKSLFHAIAEEMGATLRRTAYSPNIKERRDYSSAVFDAEGRVVAQGDHMPVHLGSMPLSVRAAIDNRTIGPGDMVVLNDPYKGGTHLPDLTLVSAVFLGRRRLFYVACRAHHSDIGGMAPGSMPLAREIFQEGLRIPPVTLIRRGEVNRDVWDMVLANVRTPEERDGDLAAMLAANRTGERRLLEIVGKYGARMVRSYIDALLDYTEKLARHAIGEIPDGVYEAEDFLDDDGIRDRRVRIGVKVTIHGSDAEIDFTGSDPQVGGNVNAVRAITASVVFYVFRTLVDVPIPSTEGGMRPLTIITPEGTIVNARPPAAVAAGNVETAQRIVDVLYRCLAKAVPGRVPAASQGTMNNVTFGGIDPRTGKPFAYYETIAGGMGARPGLDGISGVHTHMTNSLNTPVEAMEVAYPVEVERYGLRRGSGGRGRYRGGDGIHKEIRFLTPVDLTVLSERRVIAPYGLEGGSPGRVGRNRIRTASGTARTFGGKFTTGAGEGDVLSIETPGGGGWGPRRKRKGRSAKARKGHATWQPGSEPGERVVFQQPDFATLPSTGPER
jgi:N-methylhydantoinase B